MFFILFYILFLFLYYFSSPLVCLFLLLGNSSCSRCLALESCLFVFFTSFLLFFCYFFLLLCLHLNRNIRSIHFFLPCHGYLLFFLCCCGCHFWFSCVIFFLLLTIVVGFWLGSCELV